MPLYDYVCHTGHYFERVHSIAECDVPQICSCGSHAERQMSAPRVMGDYAGYTCPVTGDWIEGKKAHRENLAKHGCRVLENGEREAMIKRKASMNESLERTIEETATLDLMTMPDEKFQVLAGELTRGGDADFVRKTVTQEG
jgi:putative FmdB family regulatory protein